MKKHLTFLSKAEQTRIGATSPTENPRNAATLRGFRVLNGHIEFCLYYTIRRHIVNTRKGRCLQPAPPVTDAPYRRRRMQKA